MDYKTKYMVGLEERILLTEKLTALKATVREQENINSDLLKYIKSFASGVKSRQSKQSSHEAPIKTGNNLESEEAMGHAMRKNADFMDTISTSKQSSKPAASHEISNATSHAMYNATSHAMYNATSHATSHAAFSGKKPFIYQNVIIVDNESHDSEKSDESDLDPKIDLDNDKLVPWTNIVNQNHPKLLNKANHNSCEKYVMEFLGIFGKCKALFSILIIR